MISVRKLLVQFRSDLRARIFRRNMKRYFLFGLFILTFIEAFEVYKNMRLTLAIKDMKEKNIKKIFDDVLSLICFKYILSLTESHQLPFRRLTDQYLILTKEAN